MLQLPAIQGTIDRRILVNYRVDPERIAPLMPAPFRPKLVNGAAISGICLIRLIGIRPRGLPAICTLSSENAAHRVAVEWDDDGTTREGVYIMRRDSSSRLNALLGGRLFPGVLHHARFRVRESDDHFRLTIRSDDGQTSIDVEASLRADLPATSVFGSLEEASAFFEAGSLGISPGHRPGQFDGMELRAVGWKVEPLTVDRVTSSFFDRPDVFPPGSVTFDNALLMRRIAHEWHTQPVRHEDGRLRPAS